MIISPVVSDENSDIVDEQTMDRRTTKSVYPRSFPELSAQMIKQEGHEALNRSPEYTGQNQTFNFEI